MKGLRDEKNRAILEELRKLPRLCMYSIAARTGLSDGATSYRLRCMLKLGLVIRKRPRGRPWEYYKVAEPSQFSGGKQE